MSTQMAETENARMAEIRQAHNVKMEHLYERVGEIFSGHWRSGRAYWLYRAMEKATDMIVEESRQAEREIDCVATDYAKNGKDTMEYWTDRRYLESMAFVHKNLITRDALFHLSNIAAKPRIYLTD